MSKNFEDMLQEALDDMDSETSEEEVSEPELPRISPADRIKNLIDIREYIAKIVESPTIQKKDAYQAINLLPAIDKKIMEYVLSDEFKEMLGITETPTVAVKSAFKK